jgi:AcrR family transcriptional regulator
MRISVTEPREDGRLERSKRSRQTIIDSMITLIQKGVYIPTAQQVADEAGITIRTVFRHFSEMDLLYNEIEEVRKPKYEKFLISKDFSASLHDRVNTIVNAYTDAHVELFHLEKATQIMMWRSKVVQANYQRNQALMRKSLLNILPELNNKTPSFNIEIADAITSFEFFERLYSFQGLSIEDCKKIITMKMLDLVNAA